MGNTCIHARYVADDWSAGVKNRQVPHLNSDVDIGNANSLVNLQNSLDLSQSTTVMALSTGLSNTDITINDPEIKKIISILGI